MTPELDSAERSWPGQEVVASTAGCRKTARRLHFILITSHHEHLAARPSWKTWLSPASRARFGRKPGAPPQTPEPVVRSPFSTLADNVGWLTFAGTTSSSWD